MELFPVNLKINDKLCAVVGAGEVAQRKIRSLLEAGARVKVISPSGLPLDNRQPPEKIKIVTRKFRKGDLNGVFLAIAASDDREVNEAVAEEARKEKVLVNVADNPALCDYYSPSVVKRGDLVISISTGGKYPALSKKIRKQIEEIFGPEFGPYLEFLAKRRDKEISKNADLRLSKGQRERKT